MNNFRLHLNDSTGRTIQVKNLYKSITVIFITFRNIFMKKVFQNKFVKTFYFIDTQILLKGSIPVFEVYLINRVS